MRSNAVPHLPDTLPPLTLPDIKLAYIVRGDLLEVDETLTNLRSLAGNKDYVTIIYPVTKDPFSFHAAFICTRERPHQPINFDQLNAFILSQEENNKVPTLPLSASKDLQALPKYALLSANA